MKGFKDSTKTVRGHHNAPHPSQWLSTGGTVNKLGHGGMVRETAPQVDKNESAKDDHGHAAVQRAIPSTEELAEHGGKTPLTSGFAKGGKTEKHFHVHNHYHNGKKMPKHHERKRAEKHAMKEGGHVHDDTSVPKDDPYDYKKGGKIHIKEKNKGALHRDMHVPQGRKIPKSAIRSKLAHDKATHNVKGEKRDVFALNFGHNAGGAVYATGGTIDKLAYGGMPGAMPRPSAVNNIPMAGTRPPMPSVGRGIGAGRALAPSPAMRPRLAARGGRS
jgi:hypothetical protein